MKKRPLITKYTNRQRRLQKAIMKLITSGEFKKISADECQVIFGRIYSVFCLVQLKNEGKIKINYEVKKK